MNNNNSFLHISQLHSNTKITKIYKSLPKGKKSIFDFILSLSNKYEKVFPSQKLIAKKTKLSRQYVNETLKEFHISGIILKKNLNWRSCLYELHPYLYSKQFRKHIDKLFPKETKKLLKSLQKKTTPISLLSSCISLSLKLASLTSTITLDSNVVTKKKVKRMFSVQNEVPEFVANLKIKLTHEQQQQILNYTEAQLLAAQNIVIKKKATKGVKDEASLFFWLLRNDAAVIAAKKDQPAAIKKKELKEPKLPPKAVDFRTYEENLKRFEEWNSIYGSDWATYFNCSQEKLRSKFILELENIFNLDIKIDKLRQVINHQESSRKSVTPTDLKHTSSLREKLEGLIKQRENLIKKEDNIQERYNDQKKENHSTEVKFDTKQEEINIIKEDDINNSSLLGTSSSIDYFIL